MIYDIILKLENMDKGCTPLPLTCTKLCLLLQAWRMNDTSILIETSLLLHLTVSLFETILIYLCGSYLYFGRFAIKCQLNEIALQNYCYRHKVWQKKKIGG